MPIEESDKISDSGVSNIKVGEAVSKEADAGRADLAKDQKNYVADLKAGGKSGITDTFGKPLVFDKDSLGDKNKDSQNIAVAKPEAAPYSKDGKPDSSSEDPSKFKQVTPGDFNGAKSGVTEEFGRPLVFDSNAAEKAISKLKDSFNPEMLTENVGPKVGEAAAKAAGNKTEAAAEAKKETEGAKDATAAAAPDSPELQKIKDAKVPLSPEQEKQLKSDLADIDKLPEDQRQKVKDSLEKIATADTKDSTKLTPEQRAELISSTAHQIAHPESISQGNKDTCVSANIEKTMAMNHPDQYAQMVSDMATKGEYTTPDGKTTLKPQREADGSLAEKSDPTGKRSGASEIMQTAITNVGMPEGETYKSYKPGHEPIPKEQIKEDDAGDRVVTANGETKKFEGLSRNAKEDILNKLSPDDKYKSERIENVGDLDKAWKDNGSQPPMNVTVRINAEHTGMGQPLDGNAATHAVSITHIEYGPDGKPSQVYYENTAKPSDDHSYPNGKPVPADEFVKSMQGERRNEYKDGTVDHWNEPLTATVRTEGKPERQIDSEKSKELDRAVEEFRDSTHKDAFIDYGTDRKEMEHALKDRPRWEIEEMNRRYKAKYGKSIDEDIVDELEGADRRKFRGMLKGTDTKTDDAPIKR